MHTSAMECIPYGCVWRVAMTDLKKYAYQRPVDMRRVWCVLCQGTRYDIGNPLSRGIEHPRLPAHFELAHTIMCEFIDISRSLSRCQHAILTQLTNVHVGGEPVQTLSTRVSAEGTGRPLSWCARCWTYVSPSMSAWKPRWTCDMRPTSPAARCLPPAVRPLEGAAATSARRCNGSSQNSNHEMGVSM